MVPTGKVVGLKMGEIIDRTVHSVEVQSSVKRLSVSLLKYRYEDLLEKGVKVRILTNLPKEEGYFRRIAPELLGNQNFSLRYTTESPASVSLCFDMRETLICTDQTAHLEAAPMIWTNYPSIVNLVHEHFELQWKTALKNSTNSSNEN